MITQFIHIFIKYTFRGGIVIIVLLFFFSCSGTRHLAEDDYLLDRHRLNIDENEINKSEVLSYVRPKPNKRILGYKFYLGLYNLSGEKNNFFNRWMKKIGEEPVLWNEFEVEKNRQRINQYLRNKGYYYSQVTDTTRFHDQKARVWYDVEAGKPYFIRNIRYLSRDTVILKLIQIDTLNSLIKPGNLFDSDIIQDESDRMENYLKTLGYYNFTTDYIVFQADTIRSTLSVDLTTEILDYQVNTGDDYYRSSPHRKYQIDKVYIFPDYDQKRAMLEFDNYVSQLQKIDYREFVFYFEDKLKVDPKVVTQSIYILPGDIYNIEDVNQSYRHLSALGIFRFVNIRFEEVVKNDNTDQEIYHLNAYIQLSPATSQSYTFELEGTNSAGNIGAAGNLSYQHRNLFGGAENLQISFRGAVEALPLSKSDKKEFDKVWEVGSETRLTLPRFLLPFKTENFIRKYNPRTAISVLFSQQQRPDYTRRLFNMGFGYNWKSSPVVLHIVNPIDLIYVRMVNVTDTFISRIEGTYLQHSYEDRLITAMNYSFIYNNQNITKTRNYTYFRANLESSGLLTKNFLKLTGVEPDTSGFYTLFGNEFAQYVKGSFDFRYNQIIDDKTRFVYRFAAGVACPYGNSIAIPFEKQFYSGGANGIRAWPVRALGPGTYLDTISLYPNSTADILLEANLEYRFKLFWILEGALFSDVGNIWAISSRDDREGAQFKWNSFYKQLAVGVGFGLRMDFSYFVFRFDLGIKARDPSIPGDTNQSPWVIFDHPEIPDYRPTNFHIAIGYPF